MTDLARGLCEHRFWLARTGLTTAQTERLAVLIDQLISAFEAFELRGAARSARVADVLSGPAAGLDDSEVVMVRDEVTPEQRADLIRHWEEQ